MASTQPASLTVRVGATIGVRPGRRRGVGRPRPEQGERVRRRPGGAGADGREHGAPGVTEPDHVVAAVRVGKREDQRPGREVEPARDPHRVRCVAVVHEGVDGRPQGLGLRSVDGGRPGLGPAHQDERVAEHERLLGDPCRIRDRALRGHRCDSAGWRSAARPASPASDEVRAKAFAARPAPGSPATDDERRSRRTRSWPTYDLQATGTKGDAVIEEEFQELGPIDYMVLEWTGDQPVTGEVMPLLLDLVDRGLIRILDLAFLAKDQDGSVTAMDFAELARERRASPSSQARRPACSGRTTWRRPPPRSSPAPSPACSSGRTAGRRPSPWRCGAPAGNSSPAGESRSRPSSPRWTRARPCTDREDTPCPDCSAASPAPPPSPEPPRRSATASRAARDSAGRSRRTRRAEQEPESPPPPPPAAAPARTRSRNSRSSRSSSSRASSPTRSSRRRRRRSSGM